MTSSPARPPRAVVSGRLTGGLLADLQPNRAARRSSRSGHARVVASTRVEVGCVDETAGALRRRRVVATERMQVAGHRPVFGQEMRRRAEGRQARFDPAWSGQQGSSPGRLRRPRPPGRSRLERGDRATGVPGCRAKARAADRRCGQRPQRRARWCCGRKQSQRRRAVSSRRCARHGGGRQHFGVLGQRAGSLAAGQRRARSVDSLAQVPAPPGAGRSYPITAQQVGAGGGVLAAPPDRRPPTGRREGATSMPRGLTFGRRRNGRSTPLPTEVSRIW